MSVPDTILSCFKSEMEKIGPTNRESPLSKISWTLSHCGHHVMVIKTYKDDLAHVIFQKGEGSVLLRVIRYNLKSMIIYKGSQMREIIWQRTVQNPCWKSGFSSAALLTFGTPAFSWRLSCALLYLLGNSSNTCSPTLWPSVKMSPDPAKILGAKLPQIDKYCCKSTFLHICFFHPLTSIEVIKSCIHYQR